jgi:hypothetical protein
MNTVFRTDRALFRLEVVALVIFSLLAVGAAAAPLLNPAADLPPGMAWVISSLSLALFASVSCAFAWLIFAYRRWVIRVTGDVLTMRVWFRVRSMALPEVVRAVWSPRPWMVLRLYGPGDELFITFNYGPAETAELIRLFRTRLPVCAQEGWDERWQDRADGRGRIPPRKLTPEEWRRVTAPFNRLVCYGPPLGAALGAGCGWFLTSYARAHGVEPPVGRTGSTVLGWALTGLVVAILGTAYLRAALWLQRRNRGDAVPPSPAPA